MKNKKEKKAFTLAETLITLMVIGVVAALTIPALMQQIGDYTLQKQKDVFSKKWQEGLRQMRVDGKLETTYTTADFVKEMQKYFKIGAVCDSNNLTGCFAETITSYENDEAEVFEVKDLKSAKNFNKSEEDSDVYGIKFSDGTSMLLAYKKDCTGISEGNTEGNHTACLLYVYDVNQNKGPNAYGGDTGVTAKDGDNKMSDDKRNQINKGRDMVGNASITKGNAFGLSFEFEVANGGALTDYDGAIAACGGQNKIISEAQLKEIAEKIYIESGACPGITSMVDHNECFQSLFECDASLIAENALYQEISRGTGIVWTASHSSYGMGQNTYYPCYYDDTHEDSGIVVCIK